MESNTLAQFYQILSYVAFALAGMSFAFAVYCFFRFNIIKIINDLTGRTAKLSIAKKRSENEKSGDKSFRPTQKAKDRGKTTDKIRESEKLMNKKPSKYSEATDVLDDGTELLAPESMAVETVDSSEEGTDVLTDATEVLVNKVSEPEIDILPSGFEIIQSIVLIHTNEVINV